MTSHFVSIVIPAWRDDAALEKLLASLGSPEGVEILVVDARPGAGTTRDLCRRFGGVRWLTAPRGRATQMNAGAAGARGRWLFFLHADCRPGDGWLAELRRADSEPRTVGGSFRLALDSPVRAARAIERGVAWRVRWLGLPYGDQGLFVRRDCFERLGGYRPLPIMEDVDLVLRLRRLGSMHHSRVPVLASARRWERDGWVRRSAANMAFVLLYFAGVSPERLAHWYRRGREAPSDACEPVAEGTLSRASSAEPRVPDSELRVAVIIPALNEEEAIGSVLAHVPAFVSTVVVADNGSTDRTVERARAAGARVVSEPRRGYGRACLAGLRHVRDADVIVFLDGDFSDYPEEMARLVDPIRRNRADFVLGARGGAGRPWHAHGGTNLCVGAINRLWGTGYADLGPFRAIRRASLDDLRMADETWGWTIEMQVKAAEAGLRVLEVPVSQRDRIGQSKISGTVMGTLRAAARMLAVIVWLWVTRRRRAAWIRREGARMAPGRPS